MAKYGVNANDFLDWFFSEREDYTNLGMTIVEELKTEKTVRTTVKSIFDQCGYIPSHLLIPLSAKVEIEDMTEVDPSECKLIYSK